MEKIKSRWRKNYLEGDNDTNDINLKSNANESNNINNNNNHHHHHHHQSSKHSTPPTYEPLTENLYLDKRKNEHSRSRKDARSMVCDCILTKEERTRGIMGCLDDCLNRMLMIECGPKCTLGEHCLNKRFQKCQSAKVEVFKTRKKGWGLRAATELPANSFIMEYVGEVVRSKEFRRRVKKYTKQKIKHHYFMALRSDEIIDATVKGNFTRFINHSCDPNCETQKWTVNGDLRIGFFTIKNLQPGDEITFDYQFQRYGKKAQKCYCEAPSCRGFIGGNEQTFSLNGTSSPQLNENKAHKKSFKHGLLVDVTLEDKINALAKDAARGLKTKDQVIALASLSIKAEEVGDRRKLLDIIRTTKSEISLRLFVDYHGLEILCLWMRDPQADCDFKATIIEILEKLPIPSKTKVVESNVYRMIERWAIEDQKSIPLLTATTNTELNNSNHNSSTKSEKIEDDKTSENNKSQESNTLMEPNNINENSNNKASQDSNLIEENSSSNNTTSLPVSNTNSPNIKALANKLLKKFQALSPGFKIPRLNRLQRMEIEKKMDEEIISDDQANTDRLRFEQNNPFASRNYFKSATTPTSAATALTANGLVNNLTSAKANILPNKRRFDSLTTNNIDLTPAPKISKEEHRQQFEMHVRLKDYYDTIEKHYGAATVEQIKLSQRAYNPLTGLALPYHVPGHSLPYINTNHHLAPPIPPNLLVAQPPQPSPILPAQPPPTNPVAVATAAAAAVSNSTTNAHLMYPGLGLETAESRYLQSLVVVPNVQTAVNSYHQMASSHLPNNDQQDVALAYQMNGGREYTNGSYHDIYSHHKELEPESIVLTSTINDTEMEGNKPEPTNLPTLIVLANNSIEPAHTIDDELAFSICDYDEYYSIRDKPLSVDDVMDDLYPYPGSYYTTPNGETWFATVTLDRKTQQPRTVILNLQIRSDADRSLTTSPYKQTSVTQSSYNTIDEPVISTAPITTTSTLTITNSTSTNTSTNNSIVINNNNINNNITQTANSNQPLGIATTTTTITTAAQAPSSTDTFTESPTTNNCGEKLPGKIKKKMFEHGVSKFIKDALSEYYKPDCQVAKITSKEDFVFLARKLTLAVLEKELNRKGGCERLECNKQVKRKVEDFVRIYMAKFGKIYTRHNNK